MKTLLKAIVLILLCLGIIALAVIPIWVFVSCIIIWNSVEFDWLSWVTGTFILSCFSIIPFIYALFRILFEKDEDSKQDDFA